MEMMAQTGDVRNKFMPALRTDKINLATLGKNSTFVEYYKRNTK